MAVRQSTPHTLWLESMTLRPMLFAMSQVFSTPAHVTFK